MQQADAVLPIGTVKDGQRVAVGDSDLALDDLSGTHVGAGRVVLRGELKNEVTTTPRITKPMRRRPSICESFPRADESR